VTGRIVIPSTGCAQPALDALFPQSPAAAHPASAAAAQTPSPALGPHPARGEGATRRPTARMTEAAWTAKIRETAAYYGWITYHTHNSKFSERGWPDFVLGHPRRRRTIFAELKTETGRLSDPQRAWLTHLTACGFETALWRPSDMGTVVAVLGPRQRATRWEPR